MIIIEDDIELRESLSDYLGACGHQVTGVGSAVELYQKIAQHTYDVALVDVNLPHHDGLSVTEYLSEKTDIAIIMMTVRGSVDDRVKGYKSGADLYLVKPVNGEELAAAVEALAGKRSRRQPSATPTESRVWRLDPQHFTLLAPCGVSITLTRREVQILEALAPHTGTILPRLEILKFLGYDPSEPENRALDAAISRLRNKVQSLAAMTLPLQTVQNAGYTFSGELLLG